MSNAESRAKALELALRACSFFPDDKADETFWRVVTLFETYIIKGIQPNGETAA